MGRSTALVMSFTLVLMPRCRTGSLNRIERNMMFTFTFSHENVSRIVLEGFGL